MKTLIKYENDSQMRNPNDYFFSLVTFCVKHFKIKSIGYSKRVNTHVLSDPLTFALLLTCGRHMKLCTIWIQWYGVTF